MKVKHIVLNDYRRMRYWLSEYYSGYDRLDKDEILELIKKLDYELREADKGISTHSYPNGQYTGMLEHFKANVLNSIRRHMKRKDTIICPSCQQENCINNKSCINCYFDFNGND